MSKHLDIEALLQTGSFKTGRARSAQPSSQPRYTPPQSPRVLQSSSSDDALPSRVTTSRKPRFRPPPPSVEDEADALAREHGSPSVTSVLGEEPPSRGDIDQQPLIMEVHEHNPERRFVIVPGNSEPSSEDSMKSNKSSPEKPRQSRTTENGERGREHSAVVDDKLERPNIERRRSRQDLPPLRTDMRPDRQPEHHRTQSAVGGRRPNGLSGRPQAQTRDDMLSPEAIKYASGRRDKTYYGQGTPTTSSNRRRYSNAADDRRRTSSRRDSLSPGPGSRRESRSDPRKSRRPVSNDPPRESRYREEPQSARGSRRDDTRSSRRADDSTIPPTPTSKVRDSGLRPEPSRSSEGSPPSGKRGEERRSKRSATIHQDTDNLPSLDKDKTTSRGDRPTPRGPIVPIPVPVVDPRPQREDIKTNPRATVTFPVTSEDHASIPPYPEDDLLYRPPAQSTAGDGLAVPQQHYVPSASMPEFPAANSSFNSDASVENAAPPTTTSTVKSTEGQARPFPPFDPEKDGIKRDNEMGSYRRYSEGGGGDATGFPECRRKTPVVGKMDWLTLPRTDLNVCPDCYEGVFAKTRYRTQFQPMLRPTDKGIACDFGSSPWYRIAWLLTLKYDSADLRHFFQVANVMSSLKNQSCPGDRRTTGTWFTIKDPSRRRPVPNFMVCNQCAKTIEALLPNLRGVFVQVDSRSEPVRGTCSLHYTPQRKRFALYFDTLETTADKALVNNEPPNIQRLASKIERLSIVDECREDKPVPDGHWHIMQFLPEFTVCAECFDDVVRPRIDDENVIARNFYMEPQKLAVATCQLYSQRMREIFKKACRRDDPHYLEDKVLERLKVEADIQRKLQKLDRAGHDEAWVDKEVSRLIQEWKRWE